MERPKTKFDFCQVGFVTRSLDRTVKQFKDLYGLSPRCIVAPHYENRQLRGEKVGFTIKIALYRGSDQVDFEIVESIKGPNIYEEWMDEKGEGLHHLAYDVTDTEAWIAYYKSIGVNVLQRGERPGLKFTYLDTTAYSGVIFELLERFGPRQDPK